MIDEKKIEEAAKAICFDAKMTYDSYLKIEGFRKGVEWALEQFLKKLWHPAIEEPREKAYLLCCRKNKVLPFKVDKHSAIYNWKVFVYNFNITRWLYVDDLLPKKGGEK